MVVENDLDDHDAAEVHLVAAGSRPRWRRRPASPTCRRICSRRSRARSPASPSTTGRSSRSGPTSSPTCWPARDLGYRQRIVHHMVLGELVLRPIPTVVAHRVAKYAEALGVKDDFVRVARRYAQGAYGLAWKDLQRNGFVEHVQDVGDGEPEAGARRRRGSARAVRAGGGRSRARGALDRVRGPPGGIARATRCGRCTTAAASRCPGRPVAHPRTSRSTTSCT